MNCLNNSYHGKIDRKTEGVWIMNKLWGHLKTITAHKLAVTKLCFRCGLYKQGLLHDLSKYTPVEFCAGVKYFQGNRSPIEFRILIIVFHFF